MLTLFMLRCRNHVTKGLFMIKQLKHRLFTKENIKEGIIFGISVVIFQLFVYYCLCIACLGGFQ